MNIYDSPGLNPSVLIPLTLEFWLSVTDILPPERYCTILFSLLMVVVKRDSGLWGGCERGLLLEGDWTGDAKSKHELLRG